VVWVVLVVWWCGDVVVGVCLRVPRYAETQGHRLCINGVAYAMVKPCLHVKTDGPPGSLVDGVKQKPLCIKGALGSYCSLFEAPVDAHAMLCPVVSACKSTSALISSDPTASKTSLLK